MSRQTAPSATASAVRSLLAIALVLASFAGGGAAAADDGHGDSACVENRCGDRCQEALATARVATARYLRESVALADGYVADAICIAVPGVGAMGFHYLNHELLGDGVVDARAPEILLYAQRPDGRRTLVGLEYFAPVLSNGQPWMGTASQPPPVVDNPAPVLFGQTFNGPMPGHAPGMPWHYDLHVWAWSHNPAGTFSQFNRRVGCPAP